MDPSETKGKAEVVFRNKKTGEHMAEEEHLKSQKKLDEKPKEIKLEWGKGLAQKHEAEAKLEELECEKEKPFAWTKDDPQIKQTEVSLVCCKYVTCIEQTLVSLWRSHRENLLDLQLMTVLAGKFGYSS